MPVAATLPAPLASNEPLPVAAAEAGSGFGLGGALSLNFGWGIGGDYMRVAINYESPVLWSLDMDWLGKLDLTAEVGVSYWRAADTQWTHDSLVQFEALPLLRWWVLDPFYIEGGVGVALFNSTYFMQKQISTAFQFADQVGIGVRLTDSLRISARYVHFSNGSIKRPNPGLNVCFIAFAYDF